MATSRRDDWQQLNLPLPSQGGARGGFSVRESSPLLTSPHEGGGVISSAENALLVAVIFFLSFRAPQG